MVLIEPGSRRSGMSERTAPRVYIYLDTNGIESLYAQMTDRLEVELVQSRSKEGRSEVGLKVGFGSLLTTLLGLREVGAKTRLETVHEQIEEAKTRLTVEHKLDRLSEYLVKTNRCYECLHEAARSASEPGKVVYIRVAEKFDAPDFYPGHGGVAEVNSSKAIVFTIEPKYDPSDQYFKKEHLHFLMTASLEKFTRLRGVMGATSHEAIAFRGFSGRGIPLGVFGYLMLHSGLVCQIKPYAIWLHSDT